MSIPCSATRCVSRRPQTQRTSHAANASHGDASAQKMLASGHRRGEAEERTGKELCSVIRTSSKKSSYSFPRTRGCQTTCA
eukprot:2889121-Rhodomonas_salina.1